MSSDRMKNLKVENPVMGTLYAAPRRRRFRGRYLLIFLLLSAAGFGAYGRLRGVGWIPPWQKIFSGKSIPKPVATTPPKKAAPSVAADPYELRYATVHPGDSLESIAKRLKIDGKSLDVLGTASPFDSVREKDELFLISNRADGQPVRLFYLRSGGGAYAFRKNSSGWHSVAGKNDVTAHGVFSGNFYHSCAACGLPAPVIEKLAEIFSGEVDVASDFKKGDSFSVFFQRYPVASTGVKRCLLLAAEVTVSGKVHQAIGFELPDGSWDYFDENGASLQRQFLKSPLENTVFLQDNGGPIIRIFRPRFEIMYIVPTGAGVCAVGDGVVSAVHKAGRRFSVEIRHRGGYVSWYANLSALSRGLGRGTLVQRSVEIGTAGRNGSGKAYFDFRLFRNGKPLNFETAEFAPVSSIPKEKVPEFLKTKVFCTAALGPQTVADGKSEISPGKK
ncbi:MAG: peptidoglycan DD-metalloendopeptidase family protein [Syntrophobacteraceae bacterium]